VRKLVALLWCSSLAAADLAQLQQLTDNNRLFDLRRELQQPGSDGADTLFYRGIAASRFGHEKDGVVLLRTLIATKPDLKMLRRAHEEMADAYQRLGLYKEAAEALTEALQLTPPGDPEREGSENTQALMVSLSEAPPETIEFGIDVPIKATRNKIGSWNVPVQVNGFTGQWIFDSGAGLSTLSESEAKRMGLAVRESKAWVGGSTDKRSPLHVAIARDLQFGTAHVHNVVFLVLSDESLYLAPVHYQITGILGLPVIRALGRVGISSAGDVRVHAGAAAAPVGAPDLFFDGDSSLVEVDHGQRHLQMHLDTGANDTSLYPSFRDALSREETARIRSKREKRAGAGGAIQIRAEVVPALRIEILGTAVSLKKVSMLPEQPRGDNRFRDGVVGMDALWNGFLLDFDAMRLVIQ
jgi:predicted aspartyl protease